MLYLLKYGILFNIKEDSAFFYNYGPFHWYVSN